MKITALAAISTISAVSAQLQSKPLRGHGNGKDHPEDDAALKARVLEEAGSVASMVQGAGEYMWDGGWKPKPTTTEAVTTATDEWAGWGKPSAKSDKWHPVWSAGGKVSKIFRFSTSFTYNASKSLCLFLSFLLLLFSLLLLLCRRA